MASRSGPVTTTAVASTGYVPAFARPRPSLGWTTTFGLFFSRLALPDVDEV